ncbi:glycosyltransferase family 39 protein [Pelagibacteraceae bacterium]|nr:glycosyltransferase family 39 protein [Pelagibacteraceae bacterium]
MTINKKLFIFLSTHLIIWTLVPSITNNNLPLDTIEALAWGSNLEWGFNKHPPMSAFAVELFYQIFKNQDWSYYLLSQIFIITSFYIVYKFAEEFLENKSHAFFSILLLEGIYFYNFTTPEFNVNVCQLPFWSLTVLYAWKCIKYDKTKDYLLLGLFIACGLLSKYLFAYLVLSVGLLFVYLIVKEKKIRTKSLVIVPTFLLLLLPHLMWLVDSNYITVTYGLNRTGGEANLLSHLTQPIIFLGKQLGILIPFALMSFFIIPKLKTNIHFADRKFIFLLFINLTPLALVFLTSMAMGVKIRTMWMTPFYLFFGVFVIYIFQSKININNLKKFYYTFVFLFFLSPFTYGYISLTKDNKRTDYKGQEKAILVKKKLTDLGYKNISSIQGNEWLVGNLCYNLKPRPKCTVQNKNDFILMAENKKERASFVYSQTSWLKQIMDK